MQCCYKRIRILGFRSPVLGSTVYTYPPLLRLKIQRFHRCLLNFEIIYPKTNSIACRLFILENLSTVWRKFLIILEIFEKKSLYSKHRLILSSPNYALDVCELLYKTYNNTFTWFAYFNVDKAQWDITMSCVVETTMVPWLVKVGWGICGVFRLNHTLSVELHRLAG